MSQALCFYVCIPEAHIHVIFPEPIIGLCGILTRCEKKNIILGHKQLTTFIRYKVGGNSPRFVQLNSVTQSGPTPDLTVQALGTVL